jgi:hypothetical protein
VTLTFGQFKAAAYSGYTSQILMSQKAPYVGTLLRAAGAHNTRYVGFDVPEWLSLTAWYAKTAHPPFEIGLFGEQPSPCELAKADVILVPLSVLPRMTAMSDSEPAAFTSCVRDVARMSRGHFQFVGSRRAGKIIMGQAVSRGLVTEAVPWLPSECNDHLMAAPEFVEALFRTP